MNVGAGQTVLIHQLCKAGNLLRKGGKQINIPSPSSCRLSSAELFQVRKVTFLAGTDVSHFHSTQSYADGFPEKGTSEELYFSFFLLLCFFFSYVVYSSVLNQTLSDPPSEFHIEDRGFTKLAFTPWKETQPSVVTYFKENPILCLDISSWHQLMICLQATRVLALRRSINHEGLVFE